MVSVREEAEALTREWEAILAAWHTILDMPETEPAEIETEKTRGLSLNRRERDQRWCQRAKEGGRRLIFSLASLKTEANSSALRREPSGFEREAQ